MSVTSRDAANCGRDEREIVCIVKSFGLGVGVNFLTSKTPNGCVLMLNLSRPGRSDFLSWPYVLTRGVQ